MVGLCVDDMFQDRVREIILPLNGRHQSQGIKSDRDMRDDARTGSHRYQRAPRSAHTLDVVKCKCRSAVLCCCLSFVYKVPGYLNEMCNVLDSHTSILSLFVVVVCCLLFVFTPLLPHRYCGV